MAVVVLPVRNENWAVASASSGRNLSLIVDQFAEDGRDLFEFCGLIKEEFAPALKHCSRYWGCE